MLSTVVVIGMTQDRYSVDEDEGSVMVCVELEEGELQRDATVTLTTFDSTAVGKFLLTFFATNTKTVVYNAIILTL